MTAQEFIQEWERFYFDNDPWGSFMDLGFQFCGYVTYDREFENRQAMITTLNIVADDLKYRPGIGASEPEEHEYIRMDLLPLVEDDSELVTVAEYIRDSIDAIPEDDRY